MLERIKARIYRMLRPLRVLRARFSMMFYGIGALVCALLFYSIAESWSKGGDPIAIVLLVLVLLTVLGGSEYES